MEYLSKRKFNYLSRYAKLRQLYDTDYSRNYLEMVSEIEISEDDIFYHTVRKFEENRLDLIALSYFNNATLWWAIAFINDIVDPFSVSLGTVLKIPDIRNVSKVLYSREV